MLDLFDFNSSTISSATTSTQSIFNSSSYHSVLRAKELCDEIDFLRPLRLRLLSQKQNEGSNNKIYDDWVDKIGMNIRAEVETKKQNSVEVNLNDTVGLF